ncbi:MAG: Swt1 family HEPN domain-containing protein [Cyclobacteriaceae bacterium]
MMNSDPLYSFVFRGILTEEALDKTERIRKTRFGGEEFGKLHDTLGIGELDDELVLKAQKMAIVYTAICAFENTVRQFVSKKLLENKGENWWDDCVSEKIRSRAESRRTEENKIRWHTPRGDTIINYTEFGDLLSIIRSTQNWEYFEPHIYSIEWADQIIKTLERSRNVIMHSGELVNQDIERIGMYIRDWINQVG